MTAAKDSEPHALDLEGRLELRRGFVKGHVKKDTGVVKSEALEVCNKRRRREAVRWQQENKMLVQYILLL